MKQECGVRQSAILTSLMTPRVRSYGSLQHTLDGFRNRTFLTVLQLSKKGTFVTPAWHRGASGTLLQAVPSDTIEFQPENLGVWKRGLRRAQMGRYIPENDLGILSAPYFDLLPARVSALHLLCLDQGSGILVDALVCPSPPAALLAHASSRRGRKSAGKDDAIQCRGVWNISAGGNLPCLPAFHADPAK